jgi:hypothetical protein
MCKKGRKDVDQLRYMDPCEIREINHKLDGSRFSGLSGKKHLGWRPAARRSQGFKNRPQEKLKQMVEDMRIFLLHLSAYTDTGVRLHIVSFYLTL